MTAEERILSCLEGNGNFRYHGTRPMMTAADITRYINPRYTVSNIQYAPRTLSLATVSSKLNKLAKAGKILRIKGFGPRGGYGYARKHWNVK